jgi:glycosyltransferase involved in cell wall biosynthesis
VWLNELVAVDFYKNAKNNKWRWARVFLGELFFRYKSRRLYQAAMELAQQQRFNLVLCSTYRSFPLTTARMAAHSLYLPLVVDIRDIIEQYTGYEFITQPLPNIPGVKQVIARLFKRASLRERNRALRKADQVVTISPWHVEVLKQYNEKTSLIYNGYDPEWFYPDSIRTEQFIISYTGRLLSLTMRNPAFFLEAFKRLVDEGLFHTEKVRIVWYVDRESEALLKVEGEKYGILPFMDFKGYVPASEIPQVLNRSSVVLLLTNKADEQGPKGVMTTKFFEFLAVEKPILCVRSDEDCLERVIRETNAGVAARNVEEAYLFLKGCYTEWLQTGTTRAKVVREKAIAFSRKEQAAQFIRIFDQVLEDRHG